MKNLPILLTKKAFIVAFASFFQLLSAHAQQVEIDITAGFQTAVLNFHHSSEVEELDGNTLSYNGEHYIVGVAAPIKGGFWLRTELGLVSTSTFLNISYTYDIGLGEQKRRLTSWLDNTRIYMALLPEYRYSWGGFAWFANGGFLVASDLSNNLTSSNQILLAKATPHGFCINTGVTYHFGNIGFRMNAGLTRFSKTELINISQPFVSYTHRNLALGVVYCL